MTLDSSSTITPDTDTLPAPPTEIVVPELAAASGFVVYCESGIIWGVGDTEDDARRDAAKTVETAAVMSNTDFAFEYDELTTLAATAELVAKVRQCGGWISWAVRTIDGRTVADVR